MLSKKKVILVTGVAGFVGSHLARALLLSNHSYVVIGIDNMNNYYDVSLKEARLQILYEVNTVSSEIRFFFERADLADRQTVERIVVKYAPDIVVNLAAQAGIRYSIVNPDVYIQSNIIGFYNLLEVCRHSYDKGRKGIEHLIFASSSSVYGLNMKVPYSTDDKTDRPVSLYAATKKADELLAHVYSKLYGIPTTGLRLFTVYGPMGRPDMAYFSFTNKMVKGEKIQIFNNGDMYRDFTYIDDIIVGILDVLDKGPVVNYDKIKFNIYNIGGHHPEKLSYFVEVLEKSLIEAHIINKPTVKEFLPMQPGDVYQTYADIDEMVRAFNFHPQVGLEEGLRRFVEWYKEYYIN